MITIQIDNRYQTCKSEWDELSRRQLIYISRILFQRGIINHHKKLAALMVLLFYDIKNFSFKFYFKFINTNLFGVNKILVATNFIWKSNGLTKFTIRKFRHRLRTYHAPGDQMFNMTVGEFACADSFYELFKRYSKMEYLDCLVATLYRQQDPEHNKKGKDYKGDIRIQFNEFRVGDDKKILSGIKPSLKYAILLQYEGSRNILIRQYQSLFSSEENKTASRVGWGKVIMAAAGGIDKFQATKEVNLYDFFNQLVINAERAQKTKR